VRDYIRLTGVLLVICAVAAALLGYVNDITYLKIADQIEKANTEARQQVLITADEFIKLDDAAMANITSNPEYSIIKEIYQANAGGNLAGYTVSVAPKGYSGKIEIIVGVDVAGIVQGVKVGLNNETPGLGKNAEKPAFREQYNGKTWDSPINVIKNGTPKEHEIVAIAGSTITSKGVTEGVNKAMAVAKELSGK
jgi:Na+-translocating ferredoxin:NAD+ oxidoreductase subunit G